LTGKFSAAGKVKMVRICQPNSGPRSIAQSIPGADLAVSRQLHALIESENQEQVAAAVKQLTDSNNWWAWSQCRLDTYTQQYLAIESVLLLVLAM